MLYNYQVFLPLAVTRAYTYAHPDKLEAGVRVLVRFHGRLYTGYLGDVEETVDAGISILQIIDVIDKSPCFTADLFVLARWMSTYYHTSLGIILDSLIPQAENFSISQKVIRLEKNEGDVSLPANIQFLAVGSSLPIMQFKKASGLTYLQIEELEKRGYLKIERSFEQLLRPKMAKYLHVYKNKGVSLTPKQTACYEYLRSLGGKVLLAEAKQHYSDGIINAIQKKELVRKELLEEEDLQHSQPDDPHDIEFTDEQARVYTSIRQSLFTGFQPYLLYGITGSGKTEIYIRLIYDTIKSQQKAILLVPEIALTPQMQKRFTAEFPGQVALLHSGLNHQERYQAYKRIKSGEVSLVIGARSAIFAPLKNITLIIVDEEHEQSYKQDKAPAYNARDIAVMRAKYNNCLLILGSATPSLESYNNTQIGKYQLQKLLHRPDNTQLPLVQVVDMKIVKNDGILSTDLRTAIAVCLHAKEQIILFHNRRAYSSYVQCLACGGVIKCPYCDISLAYHKHTADLHCHYCGYKKNLGKYCPTCHEPLLKFGAPGTQQIEEHLHKVFPSARVVRMDADTTSTRGSHRRIFEQMDGHHVDILLGTQMIAKGLDFARVKLVGVINADMGLYLPDYRASERVFQLLTQVAGRAGRRQIRGEVIMQTWQAEHYAITCAASHDYFNFIKKEQELRQAFMYPPFYRLARLVISAEYQAHLEQSINQNKCLFEFLKKNYQGSEVQLLGPVECAIARINKRYRQHFIIKAKTTQLIHQIIDYVQNKYQLNSKIRLSIDVDPLTLL